jgi:hypothetical protein
LDIAVVNVHDTSCFHFVITLKEDAKLNDTLVNNGIEGNVNRDKSVYQINPSFWAGRPLTSTTIQWAS